MNELIEKIAELTEEPLSRITQDTNLYTLSAWDSLAKVSFLALASLEFGVELDGRDLEKAETVQDLHRLIQDAQSAV